MGGLRSASGGMRQVVLGFLAALISISVIFGSLLLAFSEDELRQALVNSATPVFTPTPASVLTSQPTQTPGGITQVEPTSSPSATATPSQEIGSCLPPAGWVALSVQPGDTLDSLAQFHGVELQALKEANCLLTNRLSVGLLLYVPAQQAEPDTATPEPSRTPIPCGPPRGWVTYTIRSGDTIYSLAQATGSTVLEIQFANCLASPDRIRVGQVIYLPKAPPTSTPTRTPTLQPTKPVATVPAPKLSISKSASPGTYNAVGNVISYTYLVTNSGNVALSGPFSVSDDKTSNESCPSSASLAPGASITCTSTYTITQADLDNGSVTNNATASNNTVTSSPDSETVNAAQNRALSIVKSASPGTYNAVGNVISYTYLVTNTGNVSLTGPFSVSDDKASNESCPSTASLAPGASITCTASYTITQADLDNGSVTNIATASNSAVTSPSDSETVSAVQNRALSIEKSASPGTYSAVGNVISYTYLVTNTGNVSLSGPFSVSDDKTSNESCPPTASLAPGASITCTSSYSITNADINAGSVTNTAIASNSAAISSPDSETVTYVTSQVSSPGHLAWSVKRGNILRLSVVLVSAFFNPVGNIRRNFVTHE